MTNEKLEQIQNKIIIVEDAVRLTSQYKLKNLKVVFTNGCFDILHRGHFMLVNKAASLGNRLIVGLNSDDSVKRLKGAARPIHNQDDRALALASLAFVDMVVIFDEDTPIELINNIKPDVLVKGGDYTEDQIVGAAEVKANGGEVVIIPLEEGHSTTGILDSLSKD